MLPNPKNTKNINNLLQKPPEPVVDEALVNQKKLQTKRKTIIFSLVLTAGLSFLFWSYKSIQALIKSPPKININFNFKLPKLGFQQNSQANLSSSPNLEKFFEKSSTNWSVFVSLDTDYTMPVFERQSENLKIDNNIDQIIQKISATKISSQSLVNLSLPQGLSFQEIIDNSKGFFYQSLIHLPKNKILVLIKNDSQINSSQIQTEISTLIDYLYWYAVNFLN